MRNDFQSLGLAEKAYNMRASIAVITFYVFCVVAHWAATRTYAEYCVPSGFVGILMSIYRTQDPICSAALWVINNSVKEMTFAIMFIGVFFMEILNQFRHTV